MNRANYKNFAAKIDDHKFILDNVYWTLEVLDSKTGLTSGAIKIEWSDKLKTTAGTANGSQNIITLSNKLWLDANEEQRKELVVHETCHLVNYWNNKLTASNIAGNIACWRSHGKEWQELMQKCGYIDPQRCHTIPVTRNKRRYFIYTCQCPGKEYKIKARTHNLIQRCRNGEKLVCNTCKQYCLFTGKEIKV